MENFEVAMAESYGQKNHEELQSSTFWLLLISNEIQQQFDYYKPLLTSPGVLTYAIGYHDAPVSEFDFDGNIPPSIPSLSRLGFGLTVYVNEKSKDDFLDYFRGLKSSIGFQSLSGRKDGSFKLIRWSNINYLSSFPYIDRLTWPTIITFVKEELHRGLPAPQGGTGGCYAITSGNRTAGILTAKHVVAGNTNADAYMTCGCPYHVIQSGPDGIDAAVVQCSCCKNTSTLPI